MLMTKGRESGLFSCLKLGILNKKLMFYSIIFKHSLYKKKHFLKREAWLNLSESKIVNEEANPKEVHILSENDINPKKDKLIDRKTVFLKNIQGEVYSKHVLDIYLIQQGKFKNSMYQLFKWIGGKKLIDFIPEDFLNLSENYEMSFILPIFEKADNQIIKIIPDNRVNL